MSRCSGNHYIMSIVIDEHDVKFMMNHEKNSACADIDAQVVMGTACIIGKNHEILKTGYIYNVMNSALYYKVDNKSIFFFPSITAEYYKVCNQKGKKDNKTIQAQTAFLSYLKDGIGRTLSAVKIFDDTMCDTLHWICTVPDTWRSDMIDFFKQHITELENVNDITVIKQLDATISYFQLPHFKYSFVNGDYYIVCHLERYSEVVVYGYEIGPPVRGLHSIASYTLSYSKRFPVTYLSKDYFCDVLFDGDEEAAKKYNLDLNILVQFCYGNYWKDSVHSLYDLLKAYKNRYLRNVKDSFFKDKREQLKLITYTSIRDNKNSLVDCLEEVTDSIIELAKTHYNVKVTVATSSILMYIDELLSYADHLSSYASTSYHNFKQKEGSLLLTGAIHHLHNQLNIRNYGISVVNKEELDCIYEGNVLYLSVKRNNNSILFVNSKKQETVLEDISKVIQDCYSIDECFDITDQVNGFHIRDKSITEKFVQMMQLDKDKLAQIDALQKSKKSNQIRKQLRQLANVREITTNQLFSDVLELYASSALSINRFRSHIPRDNHISMLCVYIDILQIYITQFLTSKGLVDGQLKIYFSVDHAILDQFNVDYDRFRLFNSSDINRTYPAQCMGLIHFEQVSSVYCKEQIKCCESTKDYFDYPQYFVQVQLYQAYIDVTMNAVLALNKNIRSTEDETVLTLKRRRIPFDMVEMIGEALWNHIQSMDECPISLCTHHPVFDDEEGMYLNFMDCFKHYFTEEYVMDNDREGIDWYREAKIRMNKNCECTYSLSAMDLLDICITPTIDHLTSLIYASLSTVFDKYKTTYMVIMGSPMELKCMDVRHQSMQRLQKAVQHRQKYFNHLTIHWITDDIPSAVFKGMRFIINNPLGGLLEQISSGMYYIIFNKIVYFLDKDWVYLEKDTPSAILDKDTRISENLRENEMIDIYYSGEHEVYTGICYQSREEQGDILNYISNICYRGADTYPIILRISYGLNQVVMSYHVEGERESPLIDANTSEVVLRENTLLAPFI